MWLEQSEQWGEKEEVRAQRRWGQVMQGLMGCGEDLGFYPKKDRRAMGREGSLPDFLYLL